MAKVKLLKKIAAIYLNYGSKGLKKALKNKIKGRKALDGFGPGPNVSSVNSGVFNYEVPFKSPSDNLSDLESLKKLIDDKNIKVVSFDIFDTLLMRPCLKPTDVFYVVADKVNPKFNIDFIALREKAEQDLGNPNATIFDIYESISQKSGLAKNICDALMNEEIAAEKTLLFRRNEIYDVYQYALKAGKRVIATSDMYLTEEILTDILRSKNYSEVKKVYVSNCFKKRKDSGQLFDEVLSLENCAPNELVHIGDNHWSDYQVPMKKGITAFYYPSVVDTLFSKPTLWAEAFLNKLEDDPFCRLVLGFVVHYFANEIYKEKASALFSDCYALGCLGMGPVILASMLNVLNSEIQDSYSKIYFASRDGYIPHMVYNRLRKAVSGKLEAEYFQAGRILYYCALNSDFDSFIYPETYGQKMSIDGFVNGYIRDDIYKRKIFETVSTNELETTINNKSDWKRILLKNKSTIEDYISLSRKNLSKYYSQIFGKEDRHIVFDCGYSGSISTSLSKVMDGKKFDKLYLWQTDKNKELDKKSGTKTYCLLGDYNHQGFGALNLVFEELLSPSDKRAIAINEAGKPVFISESLSDHMKRDLDECQKGILDCCDAFVNLFGQYVANLQPTNISSLLNGLNVAFNHSPYCEADLLKNIVFPDDAIQRFDSLAKKVELNRRVNYPLIGTGFLNPNNYLKEKDVYPLSENASLEKKIGLHLHLYDQSLAWEMVLYLKNLPPQTDVYITTPKKEAIAQLANIFSTLSHLKNRPQIILTENRGRDVGPWLIGMKDIQDKYDLFGHLHGKRSHQNGIEGELWRKYLFDNLLSQKALEEIFTIFEKYPKLGCVFPGPYNHIINVYRHTNIEVISENKEIFENLVKRISHKDYEFLKSDMFYSVGTMFWYRPKAMKSLFNLNISVQEFPPEPLGFDGTVPHALERIIKIACELDGYSAKAWTSMHQDKTIACMHK